MGSASFDPTGGWQTWTVPAGVTSVYIAIVGGRGGTSFQISGHNGPSGTPGRGGRVDATMAVTPGQTLWFAVGEEGDNFGVSGPDASGGFGGVYASGVTGGIGGGATRVYLNSSSGTLVAVAAGGGGGGGAAYPGIDTKGGNGGNGGGGNVDTSGEVQGGLGGTGGGGLAGNPGGGGWSLWGGSAGIVAGQGGLSLTGGAGGGSTTQWWGLGGGGGGGYYGGGGGGRDNGVDGESGGGGGGGSHYANASYLSNVVFNASTNNGPGSVTLSWADPPPVPVASFTRSPSGDVKTGEQIQFTDTSTNSPTSWYWEFGDGTTSTQENPVKSYAAVGSYSVRMRATNVSGTSSYYYATVNVLLSANSYQMII